MHVVTKYASQVLVLLRSSLLSQLIKDGVEAVVVDENTRLGWIVFGPEGNLLPWYMSAFLNLGTWNRSQGNSK